MKKINLLPADCYNVINKTIITDTDKKNLINLYEPIIGALPTCLYLTLIADLDRSETMSKDYNHHHLMSILKLSLNDLLESRKSLEAVGLLKTYLKADQNLNHYIYELFSPLGAYEFFNHPILNVILYNNIGVNEYENLLKYYKKPIFNYHDYQEISSKLDETFKSTLNNVFDNEEIRKKENAKIDINNLIDFDLLLESIPNRILNNKMLTKKNKELINNLAFVYNFDTLKMSELIRLTIDENGMINRDLLQKEARKYYEYNNKGCLPTLIYRTQPEYLKTPEGDLSNKGKMLYIFENTTPYDFLRSKYKIGNPTNKDLRLIEYLAVELNMQPAVINVLIDYVLRINEHKLTKAFVETIAGQWSRLGIKTASQAMSQAEKEHKKFSKKSLKKDISLPVWFNEQNIKNEISKEEEQEMENLLSEFR